MNDDAQVYTRTTGGIIGTHPEGQSHAAPIAPSSAAEFNTLRLSFCPFACWKVEDLRFEFDSSFIKPEIAEELNALEHLIHEHSQEGKKPVLSIFGHADPVGDDEYNKQLSGRRARAIYALLTRNVQMWEDLYTQPFGGDSWSSKKVVPVMLTTLGYGETSEETKRFQRDQNLEDDGVIGPDTRRALYRAYMNRLCRFTLDPQRDFVCCGQDPRGKGDYQGCGEFNPALLLSAAEEQELSKPQNKSLRDEENGPNRRVVIFLFRPGTQINPQRWPCVRSDEGGAGCKKRFWSDGEKRRTTRLPSERRKFQETQDTFACRFYHRMANRSPCEDEPHTIPPQTETADLLVRTVRLITRYPLAGVEVTIEGPVTLSQTTPASGIAGFPKLPPGTYSIRAAHPQLQCDMAPDVQLSVGDVRQVTVELFAEKKFVLMTYNVFLMSWVFYDSGQMQRADILPGYLGPAEDAIIFNELFWNECREKFLAGMAERYPRQSSVVDRWQDMENGGVVIVGPARNGFQDGGHHIFDVSYEEDGLSAKGVKHVCIHKQGYNFHIFGTHTQAKEEPEAADVRLQQFHQILEFIQEKIRIGHIRPIANIPGAPLEPILIGGDMNVNRTGWEFPGMLAALRAEFPEARLGHDQTWDPTTNDLAAHFKTPEDVPMYYDYLLPCKLGLMPHASQVTTAINRTQEPWRIHEDQLNYDLSDHYAIRGEFVYRF
jgi:hypothetical protein